MSTPDRKPRPQDAQDASAASRHTIPVIDRMMDVLGRLECRPQGISITALTGELALPRTTVYRILNTLQLHDMVQRDEAGSYRLGRRILSLASQVASGGTDIDLAALAQPHLDRLAVEIGHSVKLSVVDQDGVLVVAVAQGRRAYALTVTPGQRMPMHAGAAGKLLLAHLPAERQAALLAAPLEAFTPRTVTDPARLGAEAARIRRQGWSQDRGESAPSIYAYAAPVRDGRGRVVAALSIPFLLGTEAEKADALRRAAVDAADAISHAMPR